MWPTISRVDMRVDPFRELDRLHRQMNRFFDGVSSGSPEYPAVNVWGNKDEVRVAVEMPGVNPDKIECSVDGQVLTIQGERAADHLGEKDVVYRRERMDGSFARSIRLPFDVDNDKIAARYEQGVLKMVLPRHESTKPRKIAVQA